MTIIDGIAAYFLLSRKDHNRIFIILFVWCQMTIGIVLFLAENTFGQIRLSIYAFFIHAPLVILVAGLALKSMSNKFFYAASVASLTISLVGLYSFFVEPHSLEINRYTLQSSKIHRPMKIAVISDLQTDQIGEYERNAFKILLSEKPDVVLMTGDYLQPLFAHEGVPLTNDFMSFIQSIDFSAPGGIYAVRGDTEGPKWKEIFANTSVRTFERSDTFRVGEITFTALSRPDSRNVHLKIKQKNSYHIVFGHSPDFALGEIKADLMVAGHTHGGQIRLPGFGPLFVFSRIPLSWGAGLTRLEGGRSLIVSRGIGMERGFAPRLRLFCKPEIVVLNIISKQ